MIPNLVLIGFLTLGILVSMGLALMPNDDKLPSRYHLQPRPLRLPRARARFHNKRKRKLTMCIPLLAVLLIVAGTFIVSFVVLALLLASSSGE